MRPESKPVPGWRLERFRLGELPPEELRAVERSLESSEEARAHLTALESSDEVILAQYPPRLVGAEIRRRADRPTPSRLRPLLGAAVAACTLAAALLLRPPNDPPAAHGPDQTRVKGPRSGLIVYRRAGAGLERLADGSRVSARDVVQVLYLSAGERYGVVLSVDGRGAVTVHLPAGRAARTAELLQGRATPLATAYELDDAPEFERFFLVTSTVPFEVSVATEAARRLASPTPSARSAVLDLPPGFGQATFLLRKDGRR